MQAGTKRQIQQLKTARPNGRVVKAVKAGQDDDGETGDEEAGDEGEE